MRRRRCIGLLVACATLSGTFAAVSVQPAAARSLRPPHASWLEESGLASWYGKRLRGHRTASGERFNPHALTAAHAWLPFGTLVRVTLEGTGRSVVVVITDRLNAAHRIIDLSHAAASKLGILGEGLARVSLSPQ